MLPLKSGGNRRCGKTEGRNMTTGKSAEEFDFTDDLEMDYGYYLAKLRVLQKKEEQESAYSGILEGGGDARIAHGLPECDCSDRDVGGNLSG